MINYNDYDAVKEENKILKERIYVLEKKELTAIEFYTDIINKNVEIEKLKQENIGLKLRIEKLEEDNKILQQDNKTLKQEIVELKEENKTLKQEIIELKEEIVELKEENKTLKQEIVELKQYINKLEDKELRKKIFRCIQDINSSDKLEQNFKFPYNNYLKQLIQLRNDESHFIYEDDTTDVINSKKIYFLNVLNNIPNTVKNNLEKYKPNLVNEFINYLTQNCLNVEIMEEHLEEIEFWWDN
jgi:chromosome segregation ATPase